MAARNTSQRSAPSRSSWQKCARRLLTRKNYRMSDDIRHPYPFAKQVAERYVAALKDFCEPDRVIVAGSIRRRRATVKDIEIVYIPRMVESTATDLFTTAMESAVDRMLNAF